ncbi:hypothetical protein PG997_002503 [Apiospora hydei]|uniref:Uncharacterized protein n=1 Tax=Apiospora hydei TaxID=1337664 RepID=A0ABR1WWQ8_9PEZI
MLSNTVIVELGADDDLGVPELVFVSVVEGGADEPGPGAGSTDVAEALGDVEADGGIGELNSNVTVVLVATLGVVLGLLGSRRIHLGDGECLLTSSED